jgi:hypothetical protein
MTIQFRRRQPATPAIREIPMAAVAHGFWSRTLAEPGLLLKRLVLAVGAVYFTMVAATNAVNFIASVGDFHWTFLNSGNAAYVALVTNTYSWLMWTDNAAVLAAALAEGFGALLFGRALLRFRGEAVRRRYRPGSPRSRAFWSARSRTTWAAA